MTSDHELSHAADLQVLLNHVASRNAVLFLGAGFSASARGLDDEDMPIAEMLAQRIGEMQNFDAEKDLRYAASRYLDNDGDPNALIQMLRETFTVRSVQEHHKEIAAAPWRRIYTTNYDLCFERAAEQSGKLVETVDLSAHPSVFAARNNLCVHLNGSLNSLSVDAIENAFKLTTSSYLSAESFLTSRWFYPFQRDLEFSSAIVFVGYSLYDVEVQKVLHANPEYVSKTYFITRSLTGGRTQFTLEQFGTILPIGTQAFGTAIADKKGEFEGEPQQLVLASLSEYRVADLRVEIRDSDVDAFLMRGEVSDQLVDSAVMHAMGAPLLIPRDELAHARELLKAGGNLIVTAEFGNGKTVFLRALRTRIALEGGRVFTADQADLHQSDDLEQIVRLGIKGYLVVDAYEQNLDLLRQFAELNPANLQLIATARPGVHDRHRDVLLASGIRLNEIPIDELSNGEIEEFIRIVDNAGYWGDRAALSPDAKRSVVSHDHHGQLSMNLLALLSAPQMVSRVGALVADLLAVPNQKDTVFAIALLAANDMPLNSSLIAEFAFNDEIYTSKLRHHEGFKQLFRFDGTKIRAKSSVFALSLISHQFSSSYIIDQLLKIVASVGNSFGDLREKREIQKSLLRFSVVERLLPDKQRLQNLVRYYESLKRLVQWLKSDPHFWLQYGMAQLTYKDYDKAQSYFDQAYALASMKHDYHTAHIDTQQARLYLFRSTSADDSASSYKYFADAHRLLSKTPNDRHRYRQVQSYKEVFEQRFQSFSKANKTYFEHACRAVLSDLRRATQEGEPFGVSVAASRLTTALQSILDRIKDERPAAG